MIEVDEAGWRDLLAFFEFPNAIQFLLVLLSSRVLERKHDGLFEGGGSPTMEGSQALGRAQSLAGGVQRGIKTGLFSRRERRADGLPERRGRPREPQRPTGLGLLCLQLSTDLEKESDSPLVAQVTIDGKAFQEEAAGGLKVALVQCYFGQAVH